MSVDVVQLAQSHIEECERHVSALHALSTMLAEILWRQKTDCWSNDVVDGLAELFENELGGMSRGLKGVQTSLGLCGVESAFHDAFGETVAAANREASANA